MKTYYLTDRKDPNTATYYIDLEGDIFDTQVEAEVLGVEAKIIAHGFYVGSAEEMRASAKDAYEEII